MGSNEIPKVCAENVPAGINGDYLGNLKGSGSSTRCHGWANGWVMLEHPSSILHTPWHNSNHVGTVLLSHKDMPFPMATVSHPRIHWGQWQSHHYYPFLHVSPCLIHIKCTTPICVTGCGTCRAALQCASSGDGLGLQIWGISCHSICDEKRLHKAMQPVQALFQSELHYRHSPNGITAMWYYWHCFGIMTLQ